MKLNYKGKMIDKIKLLTLENNKFRYGSIKAVDYQYVRKIPSYLKGWAIIDSITYNYNMYLIVKKVNITR